MFEIMLRTDPSDCYRRLICNLATNDTSVKTSKMMPILNLFNTDVNEMKVVNDGFSSQVKQFKYQLTIAYKIGHESKSLTLCNQIFQCPLSGSTLQTMMTHGLV